MRRTVVLLLAFVVFLATGLALVAAAVAVPTAPARRDRSAADAATVRRFYGVVNDALRTGNPPDLDGVVAPGVLRARSEPGDEPETGILVGIDRLAAAFADPELRVETLVADGGQAVALVAVDGDRRDLVAGMPIRAPAATWRAVDRFRLHDGRIVAFDRRTQDREAASAEPLFESSLPRLPPSPAVVEVARVVLPPGARVPGLIGPGPELLLLESGGLTVLLEGPARLGGDAAETTVEGAVKLRPGHRLVVPSGTPFGIENGGSVPAVVLEVALRPTAQRSSENEGVDAPALSRAALVPGAAVQPLVQGLLGDPPAGPAIVVAARLTLAPGAGIAPHAVAGADLLAVETGTLGLVVSSGEGQLSRTTGAERLAASATPGTGDGGLERDRALGAGEGAFLSAGAAYAASNTGTDPVALLVVRVIPAPPADR